MIFKTFDNNIDKWISKIGIFGKSFNDIGSAITGRISDINKGLQATNDLLGSIKNSDSIWKRLYSSKERIKSQLIDVDSLYPDADNLYFYSLLETLVYIDNQVASGNITWKNYFDSLKDGEKWQIKFVQNTEFAMAGNMAAMWAISKGLGANDTRRTDLLDSVGGRVNADALNAILENYDTYEKMINEYAQGAGSMAVEAEKAANSWEGSLNRLSNIWTDTVENVADSDAVITIINSFNSLLSVLNNVTSAFTSFENIGLGVGLFASLKNVGSLKMFRLKNLFHAIKYADSNKCSYGYMSFLIA